MLKLGFDCVEEIPFLEERSKGFYCKVIIKRWNYFPGKRHENNLNPTAKEFSS